VRKRALVFADRFKEEQEPKRFDEASKALARQRYLATRWYKEALVQAETACRLAPKNGLYRITLGPAQKRPGKMGEATDTLGPFAEEKDPTPIALALLAMAHLQVGQKNKAEDYLKRLLETMKADRWTKDEEAQGLLREAEESFKDTARPAAK